MAMINVQPLPQGAISVKRRQQKTGFSGAEKKSKKMLAEVK